MHGSLGSSENAQGRRLFWAGDGVVWHLLASGAFALGIGVMLVGAVAWLLGWTALPVIDVGMPLGNETPAELAALRQAAMRAHLTLLLVGPGITVLGACVVALAAWLRGRGRQREWLDVHIDAHGVRSGDRRFSWVELEGVQIVEEPVRRPFTLGQQPVPSPRNAIRKWAFEHRFVRLELAGGETVARGLTLDEAQGLVEAIGALRPVRVERDTRAELALHSLTAAASATGREAG